MKTMLLIMLVGLVHVDMYQDRSDKNKTVIIIEREDDGQVDTITVKNSELNDSLIEKLVRQYGRQ